MAKSKNSKRKAEVDLAKVVQFETAFTKEKALELSQDKWGVERRILFLALARSGEDMCKSLETPQNEDAYLIIIERLQAYKEHLEAGVEFCESAIARHLLVGEFVLAQQTTEAA